MPGAQLIGRLIEKPFLIYHYSNRVMLNVCIARLLLGFFRVRLYEFQLPVRANEAVHLLKSSWILGNIHRPY